jgi:hypothetical protein
MATRWTCPMSTTAEISTGIFSPSQIARLVGTEVNALDSHMAVEAPLIYEQPTLGDFDDDGDK